MSARREREEVTFSPLDNRTLANLCGPLDANLLRDRKRFRD